MKKILQIISLLLILIISSFTVSNSNDYEKILKSCEYSFYVKCDGSNQFIEIIRAKDQSTAKSMCKNRYSKCKVITKSPNPKNCKYKNINSKL